MSYRSAEEILPVEIIELIQQYVDGENIYIPRKSETRKPWREGTQLNADLPARPRELYQGYLEGRKMAELADKYFLSEKSIQRIVYQARKSA